MSTQTVTLELPEALYRSAYQIAQSTQRPLAEIVQESLSHTLPPLDDLPPGEAAELIYLARLDDAALWQASYANMPTTHQVELTHLLERQSEDILASEEARHLQILMDEYGRLLVRNAHAWLLLARRGYHVPPQQNLG
jgi:hypothetical protein